MTELTLPTHPRFRDLTSQRFGRLLVLSWMGLLPCGLCASRGPRLTSHWRCECDCGVIVVLSHGQIASGNTKSCGCLRRDILFSGLQATHGMSNSSEYHTWATMKARCTNANSPDFAAYGGSGITVCARWQSFENFIADMGPKPSPQHSLDRKDTFGIYEPSNCVWSTPKEQARNKTNNRILSFNGKSMCLAAWADELGITRKALVYRLKKWPLEIALTSGPNVRLTHHR